MESVKAYRPISHYQIQSPSGEDKQIEDPEVEPAGANCGVRR